MDGVLGAITALQLHFCRHELSKPPSSSFSFTRLLHPQVLTLLFLPWALPDSTVVLPSEWEGHCPCTKPGGSQVAAKSHAHGALRRPRRDWVRWARARRLHTRQPRAVSWEFIPTSPPPHGPEISQNNLFLSVNS